MEKDMPAQSKPKLLIHMGYHKTGSTFWQNKIFSSNNFNLLDREFILSELLGESPYSFSAIEFNKRLKSKLSDTKLNIISEEELLGNIHSGGNGRSITHETIERLAGINIAEVYILVFFRNQLTMIDSCYRQYVKKGGCYSFRKYIKPIETGNFRYRFPGFSLEHLKYDDIVKHLFSKFNKERLIFYCYEDFLRSNSDLVQKMSKRLSVSFVMENKTEQKTVNPSLSNTSLALAKWTNRLFSHDPISRHSIFPFRRCQIFLIKLYQLLDQKFPNVMKFNSYVSTYYEGELTNYYRKSNGELERLTNLNIQEFGYPILQEDIEQTRQFD